MSEGDRSLRNSAPIEDPEAIVPLPAEHPIRRAHAEAARRSTDRLHAALNRDVDLSALHAAAVDRPIVATASEASFVSAIDPERLLEGAVQRWLRADGNGAVGLSLEAAGRPDQVDHLLPAPLGHDPLPQRSVGQLTQALDDGYLLSVHEPGGRNPALQLFLEDLERTNRAAVATTMTFGVRTTLGPVPTPGLYCRLMIQLMGRRHLGMTCADDRMHVTVGRGSVVVVPAGWVARHEPLDEDTLHLEVAVMHPDSDDTDRAADGAIDGSIDDQSNGAQHDPAAGGSATWPAWLPGRAVQSLRAARRALIEEEWAGASVRMGLPGGLFGVDAPTASGAVALAGGGMVFTVPEADLPALVRLSGASPLPAHEVGVDLAEQLLGAGLVSVQPR